MSFSGWTWGKLQGQKSHFPPCFLYRNGSELIGINYCLPKHRTVSFIVPLSFGIHLWQSTRVALQLVAGRTRIPRSRAAGGGRGGGGSGTCGRAQGRTWEWRKKLVLRPVMHLTFTGMKRRKVFVTSYRVQSFFYILCVLFPNGT